jgi:hypothetical protein
MIVSNRIDYIATDHKQHNIPWVRMITEQGDTIVYTDPDADSIPDPADPGVEVRRFDCMDCHNRPSHLFTPPAVSLNLALSTRRISPDLPFIRQKGLDLLNAEYENRESAHKAITADLAAYYRDEYPQVADAMQAEIKKAEEELIHIYDLNFFPEMKTDYRARDNHLSHFVNDGCFRCHDGVMQDQDGNVLPNDCSTCHLIVAQGPSERTTRLETKLDGLEFQHPEDIFEAWKEMKCTECHDPESGY